MLIPADKTNYLYEIGIKNCNKLVLVNPTNIYKRAPKILENNIKKEAKKTATELNLANRLHTFAEKTLSLL